MTARADIPMPTDGDRLDRRRKAAIVVRFLLSDGQRPPVAGLPEDTQVRLTEEIGRLGVVDRATLDAALSDFAAALEGVGLAAPGGAEAALAALDGHLSPAAAARLRAEAARARALDPWSAIAALAPPALAALLERESVEVAAVALGKLPAPRAAEALALLPGERARRVTHAMGRTGGVAPEAVGRIGRALFAEHCALPPPAFAQGPGERLGAILNSAAPGTRDHLLGGLDAEDGAFAAAVRRAIFTWAHLPRRLKAADVPRVLRAVDTKTVAVALAAALKGPPDDGTAAEFVLSSIPQRLAESLREEMGTLDRVKPAEAEAAQAAVVAAVRDRAAAGEIALEEPEDA